jgi:hypothetical protein
MSDKKKELYKVLFLSPILRDKETGAKYRRGPVISGETGEQLCLNGDVECNRLIHEVMMSLYELGIESDFREDGTLEARILWDSQDE